MKLINKALKFPFHSILLSIYPIINLFGRNIVYIAFEDILRSLALSVALIIVFLLGFYVILKDWEKAGVLCLLLVLLFFSFGHVAHLLETWISRRDMTFDVSMLPWVWLFIFLLLTFIILQAELPEMSTQFLNVSSLVLFIFPLLTIIPHIVANREYDQSERDMISQMRGEAQAEASLREMAESERPDIYYIIPDGYVRSDILNEFYNYDNSSFTRALEQRGFYIVSSSHSNYLNTTYSLNTALNLIYFHELPTSIFRKARCNLYANYVNDFLRRQDYQIVVFDSGTDDTNQQYADIFVSPSSTQMEKGGEINPFERLLLRTTLGLLFFERESLTEKPSDGVIASVNSELDVRRERIEHAFAHLPDYADQEGRYFLFAHIYLPHFPFLYGPDGKALPYHEDLNLYWYQVEPENYVEYYTYQIDYLNQAILDTVDTILETSEKPVIIILQSDHGDEKHLDWNAPSTQGVNVRSAAFSAIYFSDHSYDALYPTMTTVNTFRVTLNHWFGTQYPLLPDKVFFHEHTALTSFNKKPKFIDSCAQFNLCLPTHPD